jgi:FkbM family methyltransferase
MEKILYTIEPNSLCDLPMEARRELGWLLSVFHFSYFMNSGMIFHIAENDTVYGEWNDIKIQVRDYSDAMSLFQFAYDYYNFSILDTLNDVTVVDIGAYVGVSTCYFSKHPHVSKVFSYEPFKENYEQLLSNLKLNPELPNKAVVKNWGLSDQVREEMLPFYPRVRYHSGVKSVNFLNFHSNLFDLFDYDSSYDVSCMFEDIKNVQTEFFTGNPVLIFINAMGFEEKIFQRVFSSVDISQIKAVVGHFYYDFGIDRLFSDNGFEFCYNPLTFSSFGKKFGSFHAYRFN